MKKQIIETLEKYKNICCDGTTSMVLDLICEELSYDLNKMFRWNGRTIYLKENGNYKKIATIKVYKEKIVEGSISSVDNYKLFI